jgi:Dyp-type peroxidase family
VSWFQNGDSKKSKVSDLERLYRERKRRQAGVEFPSARKQEHILIIRFDVSRAILEEGRSVLVRQGLKKLCSYFDDIDKGKIKFVKMMPNGRWDLVRLSDFEFSATIGFGKGFFDKLKISNKNTPKKIKEMPDHLELRDPLPYKILQTDFLIQLCSNNEDVNRRVFQNNSYNPKEDNMDSRLISGHYFVRNRGDGDNLASTDVYSSICNWAQIIDTDIGFQRIDGTSLLGFNDGISNPQRLANDVVWTTNHDEDHKFADGTYMVFQKIEHDLEKWMSLGLDQQEQLIGRSKGTGLLLGTLSKDQDRKLALDMLSENKNVRDRARKIWQKLYDEQKDPDRRFFDPTRKQYRSIQLDCPVWSHVRKVNPRGFKGAARSLIFRRGYIFMNSSGTGPYNSGLLFICFQKNIENGFEHIKKVFLNNNKSLKNDENDLLSTNSTLGNTNLSAGSSEYNNKSIKNLQYTVYPVKFDTLGSNSHKVGELPSDNTLGENYSNGQIPGTVTLGGGYYFIPPIPKQSLADLSEQFFLPA